MISYLYDGLPVRRDWSSTDWKSVVRKLAGKFLSAARLTENCLTTPIASQVIPRAVEDGTIASPRGQRPAICISNFKFQIEQSRPAGGLLIEWFLWFMVIPTRSASEEFSESREVIPPTFSSSAWFNAQRHGIAEVG